MVIYLLASESDTNMFYAKHGYSYTLTRRLEYARKFYSETEARKVAQSIDKFSLIVLKFRLVLAYAN